MIEYKNDPTTGKASGIKGYLCTGSSITIYFKSGAIFLYNKSSCGEEHIINMKKLAVQQVGLNRYITTYRPAWSQSLGITPPRRFY